MSIPYEQLAKQLAGTINDGAKISLPLYGQDGKLNTKYLSILTDRETHKKMLDTINSW